MHNYPETTDDESEDLFQHAPTPSQGPIMVNVFFPLISYDKSFSDLDQHFFHDLFLYSIVKEQLSSEFIMSD